jgi:DNA processing protein
MAAAKNKPLIVSGFALGTDITAHLAAMEAGLPTVAVLPTGIDDVYPSRHRPFAAKLAATEGCAIVTDYPPGTEPKAINFIRRNRIIAGICSGTVLVESKAKGGGMITARLAASYDRDLMVLPGRADDPRSQGCNELLREKLAEPVTDTVHFLDVLGLGGPSRRRAANLEDEIRARYGSLPPDELGDLLTVAGIIRRKRGITLDGICPEACLPYGKVARYAGMLESDGFICTDLLQRCTINVKIV